MPILPSSFRWPLILLAIMWLFFAIDLLLPVNLKSWGIFPRQLSGLIGIPFAPFLHHGLWHLVGNSLPFAVLGSLICLSKKNDFLEITFLGTVLTGLGVWLVGSQAYHVGASGLVMMYWAYLIADGYYQRSVKSIFLAAITIVFYGGMIFIVFDTRAHISWSSHTFGALSGMLVAWLKYKSRQKLDARGL